MISEEGCWRSGSVEQCREGGRMDKWVHEPGSAEKDVFQIYIGFFISSADVRQANCNYCSIADWL